MYHHIHPFCQFEGGGARRGIAKYRHGFARNRRGEKISTVKGTTIFQHDGFTGFEILEPRPWLNARCLQRAGVKRTGFVMFFNAKTVAFERMRQRESRYFTQTVVENFSGGNFHNLQRIIGPGAAQA
ncbi:hypothetical protein D3C73_1261930 [compost metagenome]